jgi:hypothetical protein
MLSIALQAIVGITAAISLLGNWRQRRRLKKLVRYEVENEGLRKHIEGLEFIIRRKGLDPNTALERLRDGNF